MHLASISNFDGVVGAFVNGGEVAGANSASRFGDSIVLERTSIFAVLNVNQLQIAKCLTMHTLSL